MGVLDPGQGEKGVFLREWWQEGLAVGCQTPRGVRRASMCGWWHKNGYIINEGIGPI